VLENKSAFIKWVEKLIDKTFDGAIIENDFHYQNLLEGFLE